MVVSEIGSEAAIEMSKDIPLLLSIIFKKQKESFSFLVKHLINFFLIFCSSVNEFGCQAKKPRWIVF